MNENEVFHACYTRTKVGVGQETSGYGFSYTSTETLDTDKKSRLFPLVNCINFNEGTERFFAIIPSKDEHLAILSSIDASDGERKTPFTHVYLFKPEQALSLMKGRENFFRNKNSRPFFWDKYIGMASEGKEKIKELAEVDKSSKIVDFICNNCNNVLNSELLDELQIKAEELKKLIVAIHYVTKGKKNQVFFIANNWGKKFFQNSEKLLGLLYTILPIQETIKLGAVITDTTKLADKSVVSSSALYKVPERETAYFPGANLYIMPYKPIIHSNSILFESGKNSVIDISEFNEILTLIENSISDENDDRKKLFKLYDAFDDIDLEKSNIFAKFERWHIEAKFSKNYEDAMKVELLRWGTASELDLELKNLLSYLGGFKHKNFFEQFIKWRSCLLVSNKCFNDIEFVESFLKTAKATEYELIREVDGEFECDYHNIFNELYKKFKECNKAKNTKATNIFIDYFQQKDIVRYLFNVSICLGKNKVQKFSPEVEDLKKNTKECFELISESAEINVQSNPRFTTTKTKLNWFYFFAILSIVEFIAIVFILAIFL